MNFAFTEEQEELRKTVRAFLEAKSSEEAVREQMETDNGFDDAVWAQMGESLLCAPFFSTVVLAANALILSGDDAAKQAHLPGIAAGTTKATVAFTEPNGKWDESGIEATADADGKITGTKSFVLDGNTADLIIVAAKTAADVASLST